MTPIMKQIMLMAVGAAVLYAVAKRNGINTFSDLKDKVRMWMKDVDLKEFLNLDKLKNMVALGEPATA
jgi:hypothetical protein